MSCSINEGKEDVIFASVYLPSDSIDPPPSAELIELVNYCESNNKNLIIGCDANAHHVSWGSSGINTRELPSSEETIYRFYTIVNDPNLLFGNQEPQGSLYEVGEDDGQVVYVTLQPDEEEEEDEIASSANLFKNEVCESLPQSVSNVKLVTLDNGQVYLTAAADDNLTAVQPHLITNITNESNPAEELQLATGDPLEDSTDEQSDFREIQLEDGTCALINATLWNSLVESTAPAEEPDISKKKKFPCMYLGCGKAFTTAHHLAVHTRSHTGNRPYACTIEGCDKAFATGYSLKAHLRTHTGEKPYGCSVCLKHFKTSGDLQKHVRTHTGEKPFKCPIEGCDKSFTTSNIRKVHIRSHTGERPYTCKVADCGKAFASATNYKNHMRIHSGEKPYVCHVEGCGKRFTEYSSLYKHNAVHQPYRNFRCNYCSQYFKFENTLKLHKKTVHGVIITDNGTEFLLSGDDSKSIVLEVSDSNDIQSVANSILLNSNDCIKCDEDDDEDNL